MKKLYTLESFPHTEKIVYLPSTFANSLSTLKKFAFGSSITDVTFIQQSLHTDTIRISSKVIDTLQLPMPPQIIHLFIEEDTLSIGPLIGIFTSGFTTGKAKPIGERSIIFSKLLSVQKTVGVIAFLFGEQHIDWENCTIRGLFYENGWIVKTVPFPDVVYDRIPNRKTEKINKIRQVKERMQKDYLISWYNPGFFNKLDIYERLLQEDTISDYLPETHPFTSFSTIEHMLSNFGNVFIKPKNGSLGKGIFQIIYDKKVGDYYARYKDNNDTNRLQRFDSLEKLMNHLFSPLNLSNYIIQQGIPLIRSEKRPIDFRVHTNKNKEGKWEVTAIAAKIAGVGSVTTHLNNGGIVKTIDELEEIEMANTDIEKRLSTAAIQISKALEKQVPGTIGEIGFDLGYDTRGRIWLFEANSKPGRSIFKYPSFKKFDLETRRKSLEFAIFLKEQQIKTLEDSYQ